MAHLLAITFLTLATSAVSYQEQMAKELRELNSYLQRPVPVQVPPAPKIPSPIQQPEEIVDLYQQIGNDRQ